MLRSVREPFYVPLAPGTAFSLRSTVVLFWRFWQLHQEEAKRMISVNICQWVSEWVSKRLQGWVGGNVGKWIDGWGGEWIAKEWVARMTDGAASLGFLRLSVSRVMDRDWAIVTGLSCVWWPAGCRYCPMLMGMSELLMWGINVGRCSTTLWVLKTTVGAEPASRKWMWPGYIRLFLHIPSHSELSLLHLPEEDESVNLTGWVWGFNKTVLIFLGDWCL